MSKDNTPPAFRRLMDECIRPNSEALAEIMLSGRIAIAAYKPYANWCTLLGIEPGTNAVAMEMPAGHRNGLIKNGDSVTSRWAKGDRTGRVFAVVNDSTFLLNFDEDSGTWSVEPGSTDGEAS